MTEERPAQTSPLSSRSTCHTDGPLPCRCDCHSFLAIRDHMGITPMYVGYGADGSVWFASELKVGRGQTGVTHVTGRCHSNQ